MRLALKLTGHSGHVLNLAIDHAARTAVSVGADDKLICWDLQTGRIRWQQSGENFRHLRITIVDQFVILAAPLFFVDIESGTVVRSLDLPTLERCALGADGRSLAIIRDGNRRIDVFSLGESLQKTWTKRKWFGAKFRDVQVLSEQVAAWDSEGRCYLFLSRTGNLTLKLRFWSGRFWGDVLFSKDATRLVWHDQGAVWMNGLLAPLRHSRLELQEDDESGFRPVAVALTSERVVCIKGDELRVFDFLGRLIEREKVDDEINATAIAATPDSTYVICGGHGDQHRLQVWCLRDS